MRRDTLELVRGSLFIEKIKNAFKAADVDLLLDHGVDAVTIASALIPPLLWKDLADPGEIRKHFGRTVAATLEELNSQSILRIDTRQYRMEDVHALLALMGGVPRKKEFYNKCF